MSGRYYMEGVERAMRSKSRGFIYIYLIQTDISRYKSVTSGILITENIGLIYIKCYNSGTYNIKISLYQGYNP